MSEAETQERPVGVSREVLEGVLDFLGEDVAVLPERVDVMFQGRHSNDVFELRLGDDRSLILKRGRHDWSHQRFRTSEVAARLLREEAEVVVPRPLPIPKRVSPDPLQVYWRIPHPTLQQIWAGLSPARRDDALRSLGRLMARLHRIRVPTWGELRPDADEHESLVSFLTDDLDGRLMYACHGVWPDAVPIVERLLQIAPVMAGEAGQPTLAHNDVHLDNVLCRFDGDAATCIGFLDLDEAAALPPESDVASLEVLHGPLFEQHLSPRRRARVWEGYGRDLSPPLISLFRAVHLANLGFHSALVGHHDHADLVVRALHGEVKGMEKQRPTGLSAA